MQSFLLEYLGRHLGFIQMQEELKRLSLVYNNYTGRNLFIYAADVNKARMGIDVSMMQDDFYMIEDILRTTDKDSIDFYIETPGGSGETAEEIARFLHKKFKEVNFVVAGEAKSAGTILALSCDNLYMCDTGSLGPIDAQVKIGRYTASAYDYKKWIDEKMEEATKNGHLNVFDATMIAQISPGEIKGVVNSLEFAKDLVTDWLERYKFKNWTIKETSKTLVTPEIRKARAKEVAERLSNHEDWRTHGRSLKLEDLNDLLKIENIDADPKYSEIVHRIKTIIRMIFDGSTTFKIFLWEGSLVSRNATIANPNIPQPRPIPIPAQNNTVEKIDIEIECPRCHKRHHVLGYPNISSSEVKGKKLPITPNITDDEILICDNMNCNFGIDLKPIKSNIEAQTHKKITFK